MPPSWKSQEVCPWNFTIGKNCVSTKDSNLCLQMRGFFLCGNLIRKWTGTHYLVGSDLLLISGHGFFGIVASLANHCILLRFTISLISCPSVFTCALLSNQAVWGHTSCPWTGCKISACIVTYSCCCLELIRKDEPECSCLYAYSEISF